MDLKSLAQKIYTMRRSRGMTQRDLGEKLGISGSAVSMYERCERKPDMETLEALADVFNVPLSAFLDEDPADVKRRLERELEEEPEPQRPRTTLTDADMVAIAEFLRNQTGMTVPRTPEARILAAGIDRLPEEDREKALAVMQAVFAQYADYFKGSDENDG